MSQSLTWCAGSSLHLRSHPNSIGKPAQVFRSLRPPPHSLLGTARAGTALGWGWGTAFSDSSQIQSCSSGQESTFTEDMISAKRMFSNE